MNILFFNRSFYPDTEATGQFLTELCEDLIEFGHKVTVIAGMSYHVDNKERRFLIKHETYKSVDIIRASGTLLPKRFLFFRLINLGTYYLSAFLGGFFVKNKPDVIVVQTDPPLLGILGIFFSRWYKAKLIYSCKDIYPEVGIITGRLTNPVLNFLLKIVNSNSFKVSDLVICLGDDMKRVIINKGVNENKIAVIRDWADTSVLYPVPNDENKFRNENDLQNHFTIMYSGNIGLAQDLEKVIYVANHFKNKSNIKFVFVGDGANKHKLQVLSEELKLSNVLFLPYQPKDELKYSLSSPDLHLITFQKGLSGIMVPSKIYGILACGKPFVAWTDEESEIYTIAHRFNCGLTVSSGDVTKMISAIEWSVNNTSKLREMGENGRRAAVEFFDRKISTGKMNKTLLSVNHN
ncbi:MAG: glycosyltransferase family 4 protein [Candidatus Melainabacteria bacterium]|nr:glycosyltransferase family 4 protein [Candidatus Melainabacteria bacterium]